MADSNTSFFEDNVELYEALVDWPKRLDRESPFYRRLFEQYKVQSALDVACGTGHHADMFHSWNLLVEGSDLSPAMIDHCRQRYKESDRLAWTVRSFDELHPNPDSFDAAICVGNSLSLAGDRETAKKAVIALLGTVRSGGVCVVHILNLWSLSEGPITWQKCQRVTLDGKEYVVLKGAYRAGKCGYVELVVLDLSGSSVVSMTKSTTLLGLKADELTAWATEAGAGDVRLFGSYSFEPYDPRASQDLIMVCRRR